MAEITVYGWEVGVFMKKDSFNWIFMILGNPWVHGIRSNIKIYCCCDNIPVSSCSSTCPGSSSRLQRHMGLYTMHMEVRGPSGILQRFIAVPCACHTKHLSHYGFLWEIQWLTQLMRRLISRKIIILICMNLYLADNIDVEMRK